MQAVFYRMDIAAVIAFAGLGQAYRNWAYPRSSHSPMYALWIAVDSGDKNKTTIANFRTGALTIIAAPWRSDMVRPSDLAVRVSDAQLRDTFRLPIDAARRKAREIIDQNPRDGLTPTVENWRQLPDGQIEFAIRYFSAD
jgi:hypothetical protein